MIISLDQLIAMMADKPDDKIVARAKKYYPHILDVAAIFDISTPKRWAQFIATLVHESGAFRYVEELASGDAYDTRTDLGNTPEVDGDGRKYKGRGLIQTTGKDNYTRLTQVTGIDFVNDPEKLEQPYWATYAAGLFWRDKALNSYADRDDFLNCQIRVNGRNRKTGKPNHWEDRVVHYNRAKKALGI
jgi:putative chitinase